MLRYLAWHKSKGTAPFPVAEAAVYEFCVSCEDRAAPTFLKSFHTSLSFCVHVLGLSEAADAVGSPRVLGVSKKAFLFKRKTLRKPPLTVKMILKLEELTCNGDAPAVDRVCAGFFLLCVFMRARFSDGLNMRDLQLDPAPGKGPFAGYIEGKASRTKSAFTLQRKVDVLPMVCPVQGLSDHNWYEGWCEARRLANVPEGKDVPLLPARSTSAGWAEYPPNASQAASWLRGVLTSLGFDHSQVGILGTHSCKVTALSWCAKFRVPKSIRRTLGFHTAPGEKMVHLYGRDSISESLRHLDRVFEAVRKGIFEPDATRSGYFNQGEDRARSAAKSPDKPEADPESDESVSSEDSVDEEDNASDREDEENAVEACVEPWQEVEVGRTDLEAPCIRHKLSRCLHLARDEEGTHLKCGRAITLNYQRLLKRPGFMYPVCRRCFP